MPLNAQEEERAKEIFDALDEDGSGKITTANLKSALESAGFALTDEEIETVIGMVDTTGDGSVSWAEFKVVVEKRPIKKRIEAALKKLFEAFDTDGSGFITEGDLRKLIDEAGFGDDVTDDEIKELISRVDTAGDGKVSFAEFLAIFIE
jgi:Ca2+-binding EF-hand superfamily protein